MKLKGQFVKSIIGLLAMPTEAVHHYAFAKVQSGELAMFSIEGEAVQVAA